MKLIAPVIFLFACLFAQGQQIVSGIQATFTFGPADCTSFAQPYNGCLNDSVCNLREYGLMCVEAFGNSGEYCKVRYTANGRNYGAIKVYVGQPKNIPTTQSQFAYPVITVGTLTSFISTSGDTLAPFVECTAIRP